MSSEASIHGVDSRSETNSARLGNVLRAVRVTLGLVLVLAAGLKIHERLFSPPTVTEDHLGGKWLQFLYAEIELILGLWIVSGIRQRVASYFALGCFTCFAAVNAVQVWRGEHSCNCFGPLHVDPIYVLAIDLIGCLFAAGMVRQARLATPIIQTGRRPVGQWTTWRTVTLVLAIVFFASGVAAKAWFRAPPAAFKLITLEPSTYDFGTSLADESLTHSFTLSNNSPEQIQIAKVYSSCGCTTADGVVGQFLPGGQTLPVPVTLMAGATDGPKSGTITVFYRIPGQPYLAWHSCTVQTTVAPDYKVEPLYIDFGTVEYSQPTKRIVLFRPNRMEYARVLSVDSDHPALTVSLLPAGVGQKDSHIELTFDATSLRSDQPVSAVVRLHTNSARVPTRQVTVRANPKPAVQIDPQSVVIGSEARGSVQRTVVIRSRRPSELKQVSAPGVPITHEAEGHPVTEHKLVVTIPELPSGRAFESAVEAMVGFVTDVGVIERHAVNIPIYRLPH